MIYCVVVTLVVHPYIPGVRAKLGQIQGGGGCRGPAKIRKRGGCNDFLFSTR